MDQRMKGYFYAIISGVFLGFVPLAILSVTRSGAAESSFCIMVRMLVASVFMLPISAPRMKGQVTVRFTLRMIITAFFMSITSVLLYTSYDYLPSGISITLHYTFPVIILLASVLIFHQKISRKTVFAMFISMSGVIVLCDSSVMGENAWVGILFAMGSAMAFSTYLLWVEHSGMGKMDPILFTQFLTAFNVVILFIYNLIIGHLSFDVSLSGVLLLCLSGVLAALAQLTQQLAIKYVGSVYTSILETFELVICTLGSALLLGDAISFRVIIGGALVLAAMILITMQDAKKESKA